MLLWYALRLRLHMSGVRVHLRQLFLHGCVALLPRRLSLSLTSNARFNSKLRPSLGFGERFKELYCSYRPDLRVGLVIDSRQHAVSTKNSLAVQNFSVERAS